MNVSAPSVTTPFSLHARLILLAALLCLTCTSVLAQATNPDYRSCSTLTDCLNREALAEVFNAVGKMVPNLRWTIQDLWVTEDRIVVLGEASGTPTESFFGIEPTGRSFKTISLDIFTVKNGKLSSAYHVENWVGAIAQVKGE